MRYLLEQQGDTEANHILTERSKQENNKKGARVSPELTVFISSQNRSSLGVVDNDVVSQLLSTMSSTPTTVWKKFPLSFNNQQFKEMEKTEQVAQIIVQRGIVLKGARVKNDLAGTGVFSYAELN